MIARIINTNLSKNLSAGLNSKYEKLPTHLKFGKELIDDPKYTKVWLNPKAKKNEKYINFYAYTERDFSELSNLLNKISIKEQEMQNKNYDLQGIKSFNRNFWLDFAKNSNAIEGVLDDFSVDLMDLNVKLKGSFNFKPDRADFDRAEYFDELSKISHELELKNDSVVISGNKKQHTINIDTARHFMAFRYIYKCAKQDRCKTITKQDFCNLTQNVHAILSGNTFSRFRNNQAFISSQSDEYNFNWIPETVDRLDESFNGLSNWIASDKSSGRLHPIVKSAIFHAEFIRIHPFFDGNGRTGRLLSNYLLIRNEIPTITLKNKYTKKYIDVLEYAIKTHDVDRLIDVFYNATLDSANKIYDCLLYIEKNKKPNIAKENQI